MPFYEYQCTKCDHKEEVLQKINDKPLKKCPSCGRPTMKKLVSAAAFRLKGSGWYETDFKSGEKKNIEKSDNQKADSQKSAGKAEAAGATKKDTAGVPAQSKAAKPKAGPSTTTQKQVK